MHSSLRRLTRARALWIPTRETIWLLLSLMEAATNLPSGDTRHFLAPRLGLSSLTSSTESIDLKEKSSGGPSISGGGAGLLRLPQVLVRRRVEPSRPETTPRRVHPLREETVDEGSPPVPPRRGEGSEETLGRIAGGFGGPLRGGEGGTRSESIRSCRGLGPDRRPRARRDSNPLLSSVSLK